MTASALKTSIHELVNLTDDEDVLQSLYLLLRKLVPNEEDNIIGYEPDGTPITEKAFIESILEADAEIEAGNGITLDALKAKYGYQAKRSQAANV